MADPVALAERPKLRLFTLCALYAAQGIPWGFVFITLKAWLGDAGLSVDEVGEILVLGSLPWVFKPLWGPVIDAVGPTSLGRRRPWIVAAQLGMAATLAAMLAIPDLETDLRLLGWMVFAHNVFNSLQDVAVDALAVDLLTDDERGRANGLMYGSKYGGGAIGGAGMATLAAVVGLKGALLLQVGMLALIMLLPLLLLERPGERRFPWETVPAGFEGLPKAALSEGLARGLDTARSLLKAFSLRSTLTGGVLAWLVHIPLGVLSAVGAVFFTQHLGWSREFYAQIDGGPVLAAGLIASVAGGFVADKLGRRRAVGLGIALAGSLAIGFSLSEAQWGNTAFVSAYLIADAACVGLVSVGLFALFMDISWPKVAATQFTTYMALLNFSSTTGQKVAGRVEEWDLSYPEVFLYAGLFQLAVIALLPLIDPGQTRRVLASDSEGT